MLLPLYLTNVLLPSVVARPLQDEPQTIDLVVGNYKSNTSASFKRVSASRRRGVCGCAERKLESRSKLKTAN
jgi:hypothetical protein